MPNLGFPEIALIVLVILVLFGAKRLPDAARSLGRSMRIFKSEMTEMTKDGEDARTRQAVEPPQQAPVDPNYAYGANPQQQPVQRQPQEYPQPQQRPDSV